jgi:hypothetical protein
MHHQQPIFSKLMFETIKESTIMTKKALEQCSLMHCENKKMRITWIISRSTDIPRIVLYSKMH